jgi:hypothetical protein
MPSPEQLIPAKDDYALRHFRLGWSALLLFTAFGLALETLHGFKIGAYLDVSNQTRRLMWTLAHSHGTLLSIVNLMFAVMLRTFPEIHVGTVRAISQCLIFSTVLLPGGFFLGGIIVYGGDPSLGILLVPVGALLLIAAIVLLVRAIYVPVSGQGTPRTSREKRPVRN